ncbi:MAG TPA: 6-phosphogluconolactonase [Actinomycetota bacterium]
MPSAPAGEPSVRILADADAVSLAAAEHVAGALRRAVEATGRGDWATTGGSTVVGIYRALAASPLRDEVPWSGVHLWWGDDRYVPPEHALSNVLPADAVLLNVAARAGLSGQGEDAEDVRRGREAGAWIPTSQVHPFPVAEAIGRRLEPAWAAARYEQDLRNSGIDVVDGWPAFDLVLLGIGPDGHLLSVFPGSPALDESTAWALPVPAPTHVEPHVARVTLNPRIIEAARDVLVVVHGEGKAGIVGEVFGAERDPRRWPAQLARRAGATWLLDEAAAARLPAARRA